MFDKVGATRRRLTQTQCVSVTSWVAQAPKRCVLHWIALTAGATSEDAYRERGHRLPRQRTKFLELASTTRRRVCNLLVVARYVSEERTGES